jgi:hypothetical protein
VTVVLVDIRPAPAAVGQAELVRDAREHRPDGPLDVCVVCDRHWPCPRYFTARYALIRAGIPPAVWVRPA